MVGEMFVEQFGRMDELRLGDGGIRLERGQAAFSESGQLCERFDPALRLESHAPDMAVQVAELAQSPLVAPMARAFKQERRIGNLLRPVAAL